MMEPEADLEFGPCEVCGKGPWSKRAHYVSHWRASHAELEPPADAMPRSDSKPATRTTIGSTKGGKPSLAPLISAQLKGLGMLWSMRDDVCGPALTETAQEIAEAVNDIAQGNDKLYRRLTEGATNMSYVRLALALGRVANAVRDHHVAPRIEAIRARREEAQAEWEAQQMGLAGPEVPSEPAA